MGDSKDSHFQKRNDQVYVSNLHYRCIYQDVKDLFKKVGEVRFVEMLKDDNNRPNGCAVVRFKDNDLVIKAIDKLNRSEYKGRNLVVRDYRDSAHAMAAAKTDGYVSDRKRPRDDDFDTMEKPIKHGNTYGLALTFLESLGIDGPLNNRVFVANLPYDAKEEDIKNLFSICGKVEDVELVTTDGGSSKGFGFVEFDHPIEAVQAISMLHNQPYRDRKLSIQYTQREKRPKNSGSKLPPGLLSIGMGLGVNGTALKDVARTIEAGQQKSLLGVHLNASSIAPLSLSSGVNQNFCGNFTADNQRNPSPLMASNLREKLFSGAGLLDMPSDLPFRNSRPLRDSTSIGLGSSLMGPRNCIKVSNLPPDYTWKALYDLCQSFGEVSFNKIASRGIGVVHFESDTAARRAIDMLDQQEFEGRYLEAKFM